MTPEYPQKHIAPLLWKIWGPIPTECQLFLMITVLEKSRHMNILHSKDYRFSKIPMVSAYKQCGNSALVPVMRRIVEQIMNAVEND